MSQSATAYLISAYRAGSGYMWANFVDAVVAGLDCVPNQVTIHAPNSPISTTYSLSALPSGSKVAIGGVISGTDRDYPIGSPLSFLLVPSSSGLTLTTTGTGAATLVGSNLNVPTPSAGTGTVTTTGSPTSGKMAKFSGATSIVDATPGTDYIATNPVFVASGASHAAGLVPDPGASSGTTHFLREDATWAVPPGGGGTGTVTTASIVSANGFAGTVANATTTPAFTITTSITGILKGNGAAMSAATAGTDYVVPSGNITGTSSNVTGTVAIANGGTGLTSGITGLVKGSGTAYAAAVPLTDYQPPITGSAFQPVGIASDGATVAGLSTPIIPTVTATYGSTTTFNLALSNRQKVTLAGNPILAVSNVQPDQVFVLNFIQDGTGSRTIGTWFPGITWIGGAPPTLQTTPGATDSIAFWCTGTNTYQGYPSGFPLPGTSGQIPYNNGAALVGASGATIDTNSCFSVGSAISDPGTPVAGAIWQSSKSNGPKIATLAGYGGITRSIFSCESCTPVASSASATSIFGSPSNAQGSLTFPANSLKPGNLLQWQIWGTWGTTGSSPTIGFGVYLNGTLILDIFGNPFTCTVAQTTKSFYNQFGFLRILTVGASATAGGNSNFVLQNPGGSTGQVQCIPGGSLANLSTTFASNSSAPFDIKATWSVSSASNIISVAGFNLWMVQ